MRKLLGAARFCGICLVTVVLLLMNSGYCPKEGRAQTNPAVCSYKLLLLIYPNTDVTYEESTGTRTFRGNMTMELETVIMCAFKQLPNLIKNGSNNAVESTYCIVDISRPITRITKLQNYMYWLSPEDIGQDLKLFAEAGTYDSVHVIWYSGTVMTYWGMGGVFINNGTTTFSSIIAGETRWWTSNGEQVFLHEWLHGVCRFYSGLGYVMPEGDADGADEHGYSESSTEGWMPYYRDLMRGQVWEQKLSAYTGITVEAWAKATPSALVPELPSFLALSLLIVTTLLAVIVYKRKQTNRLQSQKMISIL